MEKIVKPKALKSGSTIGIFSPSEPILSRREPKVNSGIIFLEKEGFNIITGKNYLEKNYYMAGTPQKRVDDIHSFLNNDDVDLLFASWGGKNENQILPYLDYSLIRAKKKIFVGISDSTCLANAIYAKSGLINFLGPNIIGKLDESEYSNLKYLKSIDNTSIIIDTLDEKTVLKKGIASGRLIGGTINSFILGVVGTEFEPKIENSILILEAGSRTPQELDQLLTYMINTKKFNKIGGLIICNTDNCKDLKDWGGRSAIDIFMEKFSHLDIPIIHTPIIGHGKLRNPILPIGAICKLDTYNGMLTAEENVVS